MCTVYNDRQTLWTLGRVLVIFHSLNRRVGFNSQSIGVFFQECLEDLGD